MQKVVKWLNENQCPICFGSMILEEKEISYYEVDDEGYTSPYFNNFDSLYSTALYCPNCNKYYNATLNNGIVQRVKRKCNTQKKEVNPFYG